MTRLVVVAHGTRHRVGNRVAVEIAAAAGRRLGMPAVAAYVELCEPLLADLLAAGAEPTIVVPLLLSTGYHVRVDLPAAVAGAAGPATLAAPLGPDPLLARAQVVRLRAAGARPGQPVTMVAAGSNDPAATVDLHTAADLLCGAWGAPVRLATLAGHGPRPEQVLRPGDAVSPYLLAPGHFADRAGRLTGHGADVVATPIGSHPALVDLIALRAGTRTAVSLAG
ncbi:MAG: CbiX/SirB N-terminal domain-containing protein [Nocardioides sp.]|uniref:sirohydrochlorin chelatase n=1 Tax=Nocardioides sp. TaxID=35761 RepID=UPI0039E40CF6